MNADTAMCRKGISAPVWGAGAIVLAVALGAWAWFPVWHGDAAIYLPYVRALWEGGRWMEFNPGEMSSGATSPLWVLWLLPWWGIAGSVGVKLAGAFMVACAVGAAYLHALCRGATAWEALLPVAVVAYCAAPAGFLGYETPLAALAGIAWVGVFAGSLTRQAWMAALAALSPLVRPELGIFAGVAFVDALLKRRWDAVRGLLGGTLVPVAYYGAMSVLTGSFSTSAYCRAFALRELADVSILGLGFHSSVIVEAVRSGLLLVGGAALVGIWDLWRVRNRLWVPALGSVVCFGLFFTTIAPLNHVRYAAPIAFLLGYLALVGLKAGERWHRAVRHVHSVVLALLVVALIAKAWDERRRGWGFEVVTERECAEILNTVAQPGEVVLAYEVQIRYWLRPQLEVLSLDGITDGKVAPYLASADIVGFLKRWRPHYWVANEAVWRRPFLRGSLLAEVLRRGDTVEIAGIRFERLWQRRKPLPRGFYGCLALYRLRYDTGAIAR